MDSGTARSVERECEQSVLVRRAAVQAVRQYPGVVGQVLSRELLAYAELGHRFGPSPLMERLVTQVLAQALPATEVAPALWLAGEEPS